MSQVPKQDKRIELKYLLDAPLAVAVKQWARENLGIDPHCCSRLRDSYEVHTLYLDTPEFDLFHATGQVGATKHRVRRYGAEETLWLETKRKKKDVVRKNRTAVPECEVIERFTGQATCVVASRDPATWCGDWFVQRVQARQLRPAVQVHYRRFARTATLAGESLRLTIDSHLQASGVTSWHDSLVSGLRPSTARQSIASVQILELKFHNHMPLLFKELLRRFPLAASGFSKYRTAANNLGAAAQQLPDSSSATGSAAHLPPATVGFVETRAGEAEVAGSGESLANA